MDAVNEQHQMVPPNNNVNLPDAAVNGNVRLKGFVCVWCIQTCLVYAIGVENYTFEAQTTHLRLHYTNYANDFVSATR